MDEKEFNEKRDRFGLVTSDIYKHIKEKQLEMIIGYAKRDYDEKEIRGMLKLIGKTDEWKEDFLKLQEKRK
jgi:hypothetical protein